jgi:hypothetical protein
MATEQAITQPVVAPAGKTKRVKRSRKGFGGGVGHPWLAFMGVYRGKHPAADGQKFDMAKMTSQASADYQLYKSNPEHPDYADYHKAVTDARAVKQQQSVVAAGGP